MNTKLGLGTVQFGQAYGVSNTAGQTPAHEVAAVLREAHARGIRVLDTAPLYGDSERVLGEAMAAEFQLVTKTPKFGDPGLTAREARARLRDTFERSLALLRVPRVGTVLFHDAADLAGPLGAELWSELASLRDSGRIERIGVSVYDAAQLDRVLDAYPVQAVQVPLNVLDQRLIRSGHLERLRRAGVAVHCRSVFLQGLLVMDPDALSPHFARVRDHLKSFKAWSDERGLSRLQVALGFALEVAGVDVVLCGVNDAAQLREICAAAERRVPAAELARFAIDDVDVLNPARWR